MARRPAVGRVRRAAALICARLRGPFFILSTLAAAEVVRIGALNWATLTGGAGGPCDPAGSERRQHGVRVEDRLRGPDARLPRRWSTSSPRRSKARATAIYLFAVRDDEDAASAAGVNPLLARTGAMCLSAFLTGDRRLAVRTIFPVSRSDPRDLARAVVPVRAAARARRARHRDRSGARLVRHHAAVGDAALLSRRQPPPGLHLAIYGGVLIVVMLYFPSGIAGALERLAAADGKSAP